MQLLGLLDEKLGHFSGEILETFVSRILDSRSPPEDLLRFEAFPDSHSFLIENKIVKAETIDPLKIIQYVFCYFDK